MTSTPWLRIDLAMFGALALATGLIPVVALSSAERSQAMLLVYPPGTSRSDALRLAAGSGASLMKPGLLPFTVFVRPRVAANGETVRPRGAWLALDASGARGCGRVVGNTAVSIAR